MINQDIFDKEIKKLEMATGRTMLEAGKALYYSELKDEGFNTEDFQKGAKDTRRSCGNYMPGVGTLIDNIRPHYTARMEKEGYYQKQKDDETAKRFFEGIRHTETSQVGTELVNGLLSGDITKTEAIEKMREMEINQPGKGWGKQAAQLADQQVAELKQTAPPEHCLECGSRTGGGRCMTCEDQRQRELRAD